MHFRTQRFGVSNALFHVLLLCTCRQPAVCRGWHARSAVCNDRVRWDGTRTARRCGSRKRRTSSAWPTAFRRALLAARRKSMLLTPGTCGRRQHRVLQLLGPSFSRTRCGK